ncbi:MAG: AtpZ/AtpI family protein [Dehalococcoidia bacterium]|nr:AtpZ/AtpI family protein [Dehalococcoidia bacterium]
MNKRTLATVAQLVGIGWYVGLCIVGGVAGGLWLDRRVGTVPLFTLLGLLLGVVLAFYGMYRMVRTLLGDHDGDSQ